MRLRRRWAWVPVCWAMACGGRFQQGGDDERGLAGASAGGGGSAAEAGTPSRAGNPSGAGVGPSGGGNVGTAGFGTGGGCTCDPIECPPGYSLVPAPGGCCFECRIDLASCETQRETYTFYRDAVLRKYAPYACDTAADCTLYYDENECRAPLCGVVINAVSRAALDAELNSFARKSCNPECPPVPVPPCVPPPLPLCFSSSCE